MSEHRIPDKKNRQLERALSNTIVDKCFENSESWKISQKLQIYCLI